MCYKIYDELNSWNLFSSSLWSVRLYGLLDQELFLDLKWNATGNASLQEHNSELQMDKSLRATVFHKL